MWLCCEEEDDGDDDDEDDDRGTVLLDMSKESNSTHKSLYERLEYSFICTCYKKMSLLSFPNLVIMRLVFAKIVKLARLDLYHTNSAARSSTPFYRFFVHS